MSNDHILVQAEIQRTVENPLSYLFTYSAWHGMAWHGMAWHGMAWAASFVSNSTN